MYRRGLWAAPGRKTREGGGRGWAARLPRWVKVSLLAWWLVHSADVTWSLFWGSHLPVVPTGPGLSVFWAVCDWQDPSLRLLPPWPAHPTWAVAGWDQREDRGHTQRDKKKKGKLWSPCHMGCWDKLMMQLQVFFLVFFWYLGSLHSWLLSSSPSQRVCGAEACCQNKL